MKNIHDLSFRRFGRITLREARLFFARNKWLISHQEGHLATCGAWVGLIGENIFM